MVGVISSLRDRFAGLSGRLLLLTIFFVMLSEVLIYCPSIARYRQVFLQERIAAAHLASLALEVPPDNMVSAELRDELLAHAGSYGIVLRRPSSKALVLAHDMPPKIDEVVDLRDSSAMTLLADAFRTLAGNDARITASVVARRLGVTNATVAKMIARLQQMELVTSLPYRSVFLTEAGRRIADIALAVGFNALSTFYRAFRAMWGVTPGEFRSGS